MPEEVTNVVPEEAVETVVEEAVSHFDAASFGKGTLVGFVAAGALYGAYKGGKWLFKKGKEFVNRKRQAKAIEDYESDGFEEEA